MKNSFISIIFIILSVQIVNAQIGSKANQGNIIIGTWQNNDNGFSNTLILNANGSGEFNGDMLTYKVQGTSLLVTMDGLVTNYSFVTKGSQLTLSGGDLQAPMTFSKSVNNSSIDNTPVQKNAIKSKPGSILGTWIGNNETMTFTKNGILELSGNQLQYSVSGNTITIQTPNGTAQYIYEVNDNYLTVNMNGQVAVYQRGTNSAETQSNTNSNQNTSTAGQLRGRIAGELVGKWCWVNVNSTNSGGSSSSQCITINADGTYIYYGESSMSANSSYGYAGTASQSGDQGTWRLDGNTLNVMSQSQGFKTYTLEKRNHPKNGDPMIVIDGQTFVTYYQKNPW